MIRQMLIANLTAACGYACPAVQDAIDRLAKEFRNDRAHMLDRLPLMSREDFHDLLMVAWGRAPMRMATGRTRDEWIELHDRESRA